MIRQPENAGGRENKIDDLPGLGRVTRYKSDVLLPLGRRSSVFAKILDPRNLGNIVQIAVCCHKGIQTEFGESKKVLQKAFFRAILASKPLFGSGFTVDVIMMRQASSRFIIVLFLIAGGIFLFTELSGSTEAARLPSAGITADELPPCTPPLTQGFDNVMTLPGADWIQINHSEPIGSGVWGQGNPDAYPAQTGNPDAYITVDFESGSNVATISNWLLTPLVRFQNGDSITFWTRTFTSPDFPDRMQVRMSTNGYSTNVGTSSTDVGDFTTLLIDINPTYVLTGYPSSWTQYTATVTGVPSPTAGRFAFRYFVENGGPGGSNSDGIGVDTVVVNSCLAPPSISGTVTYANAIGAPTPRYVSNVTVTGSGALTVMATTAPPGATAGQYSLTGFGSGSYTVTPTKTSGVNNITSFDAAKIAQHVAGPPNPQLNATQLMVADVSGNGVVSSFDAGEIARFVAQIPGTGLTGTWKFLPPTRNYAPVTTVMTGENYSALLMGEVSGNWTNTGARPLGSGSFDAGDGSERTITVDPPNLVTSPKKEINIPILVDGVANTGIISYEFDLKYDPSVIQPTRNAVSITGTASRAVSIVVNAVEPGLLRVVAYGPKPIDSNGVLVNLRFVSVGGPASKSPLTLERIMFNEGDSPVALTDGQVLLSVAASD